jgi:transmembrane sensor
LPVTLATAAAVALGVFLHARKPTASEPAGVPRPGVVRTAPPAAVLTHSGLVKHESRRLTLPDGSVVDLNAGAKIEVAFTTEERRVRLVSGEAHFTVAKNPARPFIVAAGSVAVRAVGTAFSVQLGDQQVDVLVTEGRVQVAQPESVNPAPSGMRDDSMAPLVLLAGQRATIATSASIAPAVAAVSPTEMERALAWQGVRLEFADMPLADVAAEFNRHNQRQLAVDPAVAGLRVGGNFRADNVDAFVRLLESSFGVAAELRADGATVLRRR